MNIYQTIRWIVKGQKDERNKQLYSWFLCSFSLNGIMLPVFLILQMNSYHTQIPIISE